MRRPNRLFSGEIYFDGDSEALDRERRKSRPYRLTIEATDHGKPPQTARARVEIFLEDVNDNAPEVSYPNVTKDIAFVYILGGDANRKKSKRAVSEPAESTTTVASTPVAKSQLRMVQELLLIGDSKSKQVHSPPSLPVLVTQIKASDADESENGRVRFRLDKGNTNDYFKVDVMTGNVTLLPRDEDSLRQMKRGCHVIEVTVQDLGVPHPMSTLTWVSYYGRGREIT